MSVPPTAAQMPVLRFIHGYVIASGGIAPTVQEIATGCGCAKSEAKRRLDRLVDRGLVRRLPARERAIEVLHPPSIPTTPDGEPLYFVPLGRPEPRTERAR